MFLFTKSKTTSNLAAQFPIEAVKRNIDSRGRNFQVWGFLCDIKDSVSPIPYLKIWKGVIIAFHFFLETYITRNLFNTNVSRFPFCAPGSEPTFLQHFYSGCEQKLQNSLFHALHLWSPLELELKRFLASSLCKSSWKYVEKLDRSDKKGYCEAFFVKHKFKSCWLRCTVSTSNLLVGFSDVISVQFGKQKYLTNRKKWSILTSRMQNNY